MDDNVVDFPKKDQPVEEDGMYLYACECDNTFFFVTTEGIRCASPTCGEYLSFDDYEQED